MTGWSINREEEQLDLQKARLQEIIAGDLVSPGMKSDLQRLIDDISTRMHEINNGQNNTLTAKSN